MNNKTRMNRSEAKRKSLIWPISKPIYNVLTWIGLISATKVLFYILAVLLNFLSRIFMYLHEFMVFISSCLIYYKEKGLKYNGF